MPMPPGQAPSQAMQQQSLSLLCLVSAGLREASHQYAVFLQPLPRYRRAHQHGSSPVRRAPNRQCAHERCEMKNKSAVIRDGEDHPFVHVPPDHQKQQKRARQEPPSSVKPLLSHCLQRNLCGARCSTLNLGCPEPA